MNDDPVLVGDGARYRAVRHPAGTRYIEVLDQRALPHAVETQRLDSVDAAATAIRDMVVRGAPLIGAVGAYGFALGLDADAGDDALAHIHALLDATRPTAVNLRWALDDMRRRLAAAPPSQRAALAYARAAAVCAEDIAINQAIGTHGSALIRAAAARKKSAGPVNVLTHCNAGWLATVDWGTALAPVFRAHDDGIPVHVWVDETRPRNQGASLTAWELGQHGVPHTIIVDNVGGHLMQHGKVDLCITGTDRTTATGDVANKIGTYLKALAARDNGVPFYVALPSPTIDWTVDDGVREIPIEERHGSEVSEISGRLANGDIATVRLIPEGSAVANYAFDVTPSRLVTGLITERGICAASADGLLGLFPERRTPKRSTRRTGT
jgi:methylthioribose-1-phosphate isomerase